MSDPGTSTSGVGSSCAWKYRHGSAVVSRVGGLGGDERGAMMVVGVFMSVFLVGVVWHIMGIGDAVLYKERMQDGADAVAFAAAVYHARGMNLVAMINIIMAAILAILVAFKLLQLINNIVNVITAICSVIPWTAAVCAPIFSLTTNLKSPISQGVEAAQKLNDAALPALSKAQKGIGYAFPWLAEVKAVTAWQDYDKPARFGAMFSSSLVTKSPRLGLPIEEDEFKYLCKKAGENVGKVVFLPFGSFGDWVGKAVGNLASTFPGYFCGESGGGAGVGEAMGNTVDTAVKQACDEAKEKAEASGDDEFDYDECMKEAKKEILKDPEYSNPSASTAGDGSDKTPKKVFSEAKNGSSHFQVWSFTLGDSGWAKRADDGVKLPSWNKTPSPLEIPLWGDVSFAQAEFYYDVSGKWADHSKDAMWNMYWRARMRRFRIPSDTSSNGFGDVGGVAIDDVIEGLGKVGFVAIDLSAGIDLTNAIGKHKNLQLMADVDIIH